MRYVKVKNLFKVSTTCTLYKGFFLEPYIRGKNHVGTFMQCAECMQYCKKIDKNKGAENLLCGVVS